MSVALWKTNASSTCGLNTKLSGRKDVAKASVLKQEPQTWQHTWVRYAEQRMQRGTVRRDNGADWYANQLHDVKSGPAFRMSLKMKTDYTLLEPIKDVARAAQRRHVLSTKATGQAQSSR